MYYDLYLKTLRIHQKAQIELERTKKVNSRLLLKVEELEREMKLLKQEQLTKTAKTNSQKKSTVKKSTTRRNPIKKSNLVTPVVLKEIEDDSAT